MTLDPVRYDSRCGGQVLRYHTWPVHRQQSVAEHTWQMMRVLLAIWPDAPAAALRYALHHDTGEVATGDIPFPVKREQPEVKAIMDRLEDEALAVMGIVQPEIPAHWRWRIKVADMLEMWEFGLDELCLGNKMAKPIVARTMEVVLQMATADGLGDDLVLILDWVHRRTEWYDRATS